MIEIAMFVFIVEALAAIGVFFFVSHLLSIAIEKIFPSLEGSGCGGPIGFLLTVLLAIGVIYLINNR
jgi:hypothetical protein